MIKAYKKDLELVGTGEELLFELSSVVKGLRDSFVKGDIDAEAAAKVIRKSVEFGLNAENVSEDKKLTKGSMQEVEDLLEELLSKLKGRGEE